MSRGRRGGTRRRLRREDHGQLLLLAGIILVLSFVAMAFTLAQVADLDKRSASEQKVDFVGEFRFMREKMGTVLRDSTGTTTDQASFLIAFDTTVESHRMSLLSKGFDARITLVGSDLGLGLAECEWLDQPASPCTNTAAGATTYANVEAVNGDQPLSHDYDGTSDGIIWACGTTPPSGFIVGMVVHMFMSDGTTSVSETVVYALNHAEYKAGCSS